jgi:uncharacterized alpha-E superfamily protein
MLSRTADNLYWLSRYVERVEYLARILDATQRLSALPLAYVASSNEWESAVLTAGCALAQDRADFHGFHHALQSRGRAADRHPGGTPGHLQP